MFGCHSCKYDLSRVESYESSPCKDCRTQKNPPPISKYADDPAVFSSASVQHPAYAEQEEELADRQALLWPVFTALSETVHLLVRLKETHPETFKFVDAKIHDPTLSYSQLADRFCCKKQNVLYHLRKAVEIAPPLRAALLVDNRFSRGHYAVRKPHASFDQMHQAGGNR